eukprot:1116567-Amorphochlora_amoeboformis.AAC.1
MASYGLGGMGWYGLIWVDMVGRKKLEDSSTVDKAGIKEVPLPNTMRFTLGLNANGTGEGLRTCIPHFHREYLTLGLCANGTGQGLHTAFSSGIST